MRALLLARGVILDTLESNLFISPLLFKIERPQAWDVAKRQQREEEKKHPNMEHAKNKGNTGL